MVDETEIEEQSSEEEDEEEEEEDEGEGGGESKSASKSKSKRKKASLWAPRTIAEEAPPREDRSGAGGGAGGFGADGFPREDDFSGEGGEKQGGKQRTRRVRPVMDRRSCPMALRSLPLAAIAHFGTNAKEWQMLYVKNKAVPKRMKAFCKEHKLSKAVALAILQDPDDDE